MATAHKLIIEPGRASKNYWHDLYRYRELFLILAWRDVIVRYKQTAAGLAWAILQPLLSIVIMTVIFGKVAGLPSEENAPYAILVCAAMLPWQFFANGLSLASQSVVNNANLISKIYFPRMIVPASSIVVSLVDFLVGCSILVGLMVWYHFYPTWRFLALPALMLLAIAAALGPGLIVTALTVRFRDFRMLIPFVIQFGLYVCPVAYKTSIIHDKLVNRLGEALGEQCFLFYSLNPMVGVIDGFRWAILGNAHPFYWPGFILSVVLTAAFLFIGIFYFRKTERAFADVI
ncbi:MAG: ABC transporter permease [Terracidiphilus sp.]|jgi:lipopolysaccharide transport system permease protein